jgi:hypothetical protein
MQTLWRMLLVYINNCLKSVLEVQIFSSGYLSSGHSTFTWARIWRSVAIFRDQKGSASKKFGKRCYKLSPLHFFSGTTTQGGLWPPRARSFLITQNDAPHSVWLLWTSDQLIAETSTWQYTKYTTDKRCSRVERMICGRTDSVST